MRRRTLVATLLLPVLAACDDAPPEPAADAVRERLVGTWLREYEEGGTRVRRVLVLASDGSFEEASAIDSPDAAAPKQSHGTGRWLYDGTNLKRRYARLNGKPVSAPVVPFVTFAIRFGSSRHFIGVDHVRKREVSYHRVPDGTLP
jgi:hypothetical protein